MKYVELMDRMYSIKRVHPAIFITWETLFLCNKNSPGGYTQTKTNNQKINKLVKKITIRY